MDPITLGKFIQSQRRQQGLTQADLADKLHVTDKAVSRWERGVGFPEVTLLEPLADALGITLLELMQSRKCMADTLSTGEAEAAVAGALALAQKKKRNIRLTPLWWLFYIPICGVMLFFMLVVDKYVSVAWVRLTGTYCAIICAQAGMSAATALLEARRDPDRPVFRHPWHTYVIDILAYAGGLCLLLGLTLREMPSIIRFFGFAMMGGAVVYYLRFHSHKDTT